MRVRRALGEFVIGGIETTLPLHREIAAAPAFIDGAIDIHWLERFVAGGG
jgi:acetyl-CoA carboxylase biotin carboxylase subunit